MTSVACVWACVQLDERHVLGRLSARPLSPPPPPSPSHLHVSTDRPPARLGYWEPAAVAAAPPSCRLAA